MPLSTLVSGNTITAAGLNNNFALCVLTDTAKTITVTHTWSADQLINTLRVGLGASSVATNSAVGVSALAAVTTADNSTALGYHAGLSLTTGGGNTLVGSEAGDAVTTGIRNTAIGYRALTTVTTGANSVAIGFEALKLQTTASENVAIGSGTARDNTTGDAIVAIGAAALQVNTTGGGNIAVGKSALAANTTASWNTAVGHAALTSNTTGGLNTGLGDEALTLNTTGAANTAVGAECLWVATTGGENTAMGYQCLIAQTAADGNTAIGTRALKATTTGGTNVAVGLEAGYTATPSNANVTGTQNVWVGYQAGPGTASVLTNAIAIGYQALNSASNEAVLGNASITSTVLRGVVTAGTQVVVDQGDGDGEILTLRSSDVAHGMTTPTATSTYGVLKKASATLGGVVARGFTEGTIAVELEGNVTSDDTAKSTSARGAIYLDTAKKSGTTTGAQGADANLAALSNNGTTRFIWDAEGSGHADVEWTTF
jgi:hypothetical protein